MTSFIPNILVSGFQSAREYLTPVLTTSQFYEKGQLTPEEFVLAGDYLIKLSPSWSWGRCTSTQGAKSYLPIDKQFLIIKNLPCRRRVQSITSGDERNIISVHANAEIPELPHSPAASVSSVRSIRTTDHEECDHRDDYHVKHNDHAEDEDEYMDMSSFHDRTIDISDPATLSTEKYVDAEKEEVRHYELTIIYDNYYRTPRVYLRGYTSEGVPLSIHKTMEDIMQDYVNKTATLETHPYDGLQCLSIHPCRHAATIKRIVDTMIANSGKQPPIQLYMFLFIKFIGSMIPTIEYDNTMPVSIE